jgi:soluble lytic murein transglycosylase-like protein
VTRLAVLLALYLLACVAAVAEAPRVDAELRALLVSASMEAPSFNDRFDAEVWLTDMSNRLSSKVKDPEERLQILKTAHAWARRKNLEPELVLAVIDIESNFDRFALSHAGARGLMQVMPFWRKEIGEPDADLFDIETNMRYGCTILRYYLDRENGNVRQALARYNGSTGKRWYPDLVLGRLSKRWFRQ